MSHLARGSTRRADRPRDERARSVRPDYGLPGQEPVKSLAR